MKITTGCQSSGSLGETLTTLHPKGEIEAARKEAEQIIPVQEGAAP